MSTVCHKAPQVGLYLEAAVYWRMSNSTGGAVGRGGLMCLLGPFVAVAMMKLKKEQ